MSLHHGTAPVEAIGELSRFRSKLYSSLSARPDALFDLTDALLCSEGPVTSPAELSLAPVHRRGHGALYAGLAHGRIEVARLRMALTGLTLPRGPGRQLSIALDVTPWPRPDAECSPQRLHCHRPCRCEGDRQTIPGWPYQIAAVLGRGPTSWTVPLDAVRLGPGDAPAETTAAQIRGLVSRLVRSGQHLPTDPPVLFVMDAGYDPARLCWLLRDEPVRLLVRVRGDRVMYGPGGPRRSHLPGGRPKRHGARFVLAEPGTHPAPARESHTAHERYGGVAARCWGRLHPKLERRGPWQGHPDRPPIVEATLIQVSAQCLPGDRDPDPMWLWYSDPDAAACDIDRLWRIYLRRFDLEHTFRFLKQTLGLTRPRLRRPEQGDRWVWLVLAAYAQLCLARPLAGDLRRPWERPLGPDRLTPGRVRRGYCRVRRRVGTPAGAPMASKPGPGRPRGRRSGPAPRYPVGKESEKTDTPRRSGPEQQR